MPLTVYKFEVIEGQEWIFPADDDDYETFSAMDGRVIQDWIAPVMKLDRAERTYSDFPWLGEHAPILKKTRSRRTGAGSCRAWAASAHEGRRGLALQHHDGRRRPRS